MTNHINRQVTNTLRVRALCLCVLMSCSVATNAQNTDTKLTAHTALLGQLQNAGIFDRSTRWYYGGNWGGLHTKASNQLFGMNLLDNSEWSITPTMNRYDAGLRLILGDNHAVMLFHQSLGMGTRIDPELSVNSSGMTTIESGVNTGCYEWICSRYYRLGNSRQKVSRISSWC